MRHNILLPAQLEASGHAMWRALDQLAMSVVRRRPWVTLVTIFTLGVLIGKFHF